jgi:Ca-activated chloride channel family protein
LRRTLISAALCRLAKRSFFFHSIFFAAAISFAFSSFFTPFHAIAAPQDVLQTITELVKVDVSVEDAHGNFLSSLSQNDFRLLDNGAERPLSFFMSVDAPAKVMVLLETGPAVYLIHSEHLAAAYALLEGLDSRDEVALATYDRSARRILPFTSDKTRLLPALGAVQYNIGMGELNFYSSLSEVLDWLAPLPGKRAIVLLSTGLDSSQPSLWDALASKVKGDDVVVFPIALGGSLRTPVGQKPSKNKKARQLDDDSNAHALRPDNPVSFARADQDLRALASITGGRAYFPDSRDEFVSIYREIASMLRNQYVLGFAPAHDGQYHSLTVELVRFSASPDAPKSKNKKPPYRVFSRAGYLAPAP